MTELDKWITKHKILGDIDNYRIYYTGANNEQSKLVGFSNSANIDFENLPPVDILAFGRSYNINNDIPVRKIVIPETVKKICPNCFTAYPDISEIEIPDSVEQICEYAFNECSQLSKVKLGTGLKSIREYAFSSCYSLRSIEIPGSVKVLRSKVFSRCYNLESITLNEGLEVILNNCFDHCINLREIVIPKSCRLVNTAAFSNIDHIEVYVGDGNTLIGPIKSPKNHINIIAHKYSLGEKYDRT